MTEDDSSEAEDDSSLAFGDTLWPQIGSPEGWAFARDGPSRNQASAGTDER